MKRQKLAVTLTQNSPLLRLLLKIQVCASGSPGMLTTDLLTVKELQQKSFYAIHLAKLVKI